MTKEEINNARYIIDSAELSIQKFSQDMTVNTQEDFDIRNAWSNLKDKMLIVIGKRVYAHAADK